MTIQCDGQNGVMGGFVHENEKKLAMLTSYCDLPKKKKKSSKNTKSRGEDALFLCEPKQTIGVADGVGGWAKHGVDSGIYARELMINSMAALANECKGSVNPKRVLLSGYFNTKSKGSSTACILTLNGRRLCYANVGDSGFMVFRANQCVFASPTQQHYFNCPYQLSCRRRKSDHHRASEGEFEVEAGDVVVLGTDGLFDNISIGLIGEILQQQIACDGTLFLDEIAWLIAATASTNSRDEDYESPFALAAKLAGVEHVGGKYDDITVIVAQIESA